MATSSTVPGSMTGSGNVQADTVEPGGPGGPLTKGVPASAGGVPLTQNTPSAGSTPTALTQWAVQPQNTTDTLGPFSSLFSVQTYGSTPVTEYCWMQGYNLSSSYGAQNYDSANASIYTYYHPDAGDTHVNGAHGLEWGVGVIGPGGAWSANLIELLAVNDTSATYQVSFRCGAGSDAGGDQTIVSGISFADPVHSYLTIGPTQFSGTPGILAGQPFVISIGGTSYMNASPTSVAAGPGIIFGSGAVQFEAYTGTQSAYFVSAAGGVNTIFNSFTGFATNLLFETAGVLKWEITATSSGFFSLMDNSSGSFPVYLQPVASDVPLFRTQSTFRVETGSLIVGIAAIATTATRGFLYLPSCAGAPTGTPVAQTGTVPCVLDSTDSKLWAYIGGSWKGVVLS